MRSAPISALPRANHIRGPCQLPKTRLLETRTCVSRHQKPSHAAVCEAKGSAEASWRPKPCFPLTRESLFKKGPDAVEEVRFASRNMRMWIPTEAVRRSSTQSDLSYRLDPVLCKLQIPDPDGGDGMGVEAALERSMTESLLVMHKGQVVFEWYSPGAGPELEHMWWSASKALPSCIAAIMVEEGLLDIDKQVLDYLPELNPGAWEGVTLRDCLMQRSGIRFLEDFGVPEGGACLFCLLGVRGYLPKPLPNLPDSQYDYIRDFITEKDFAPGEKYTYNEINTEAVAWACERVSGLRFSELLRSRIWSKFGPERDGYFSVDSGGAVATSGGFNSTLRDAGRFTQMLLQGGAWEDKQVVPSWWLEEIVTKNGSDQTWGTISDGFRNILKGNPTVGYTHQFWNQEYGGSPGYSTNGNRGQMFLVDPGAEIATAKFGYVLPMPAHYERTLFSNLYMAFREHLTSS